MITNGRLSVCDRCGQGTFSRCTGEGELDGGFTRWNKFEPLPEGWRNHSAIGLLCPVCNEEFNRIMDAFIDAKKEST